MSDDPDAYRPLTKAEFDSETLSYSVSIIREDPATGRFDKITVDGYGVLDELLETLTNQMDECRWFAVPGEDEPEADDPDAE